MDGELLTGGGLNQVFRVGDAVRRPAGPWAPRVHELLRHLAPLGIAPVPLGLDAEHELLSYLPGDVGHVFPSGDAALAKSAAMPRRLRDATARCPLGQHNGAASASLRGVHRSRTSCA